MTMRAQPVASHFVDGAYVEDTAGAVIDVIYPLRDAWRAHERMEESLHIGKIMLDVG